MTFGGSDTTARKTADLAKIVTTIFEWVGLLNKGSAATPAAPAPGESDKVQPVSSNSLNVTRVTGLGVVIAGAGTAALEIFKVDKGKDPRVIVVAAFVAAGLIVAAALITVAVIIAADIRARATIAAATSPVPAPPSQNGASTPAPADGATEVVVLPGHTLQLAWDGQSWQVL